jgi:hypothetical protein
LETDRLDRFLERERSGVAFSERERERFQYRDLTTYLLCDRERDLNINDIKT